MRLRDWHWTYLWLAGFLGTLGGWSLEWLRCYLLPISGGLLARADGVERRRCVGYAVATTMAFSLPCSPDRQSWVVIAAVGACYGTTPLIVSFRWRRLWWPLLTAAVLVGLLALSTHWTLWRHQWTEMAVFGLHGFLVAYTIDRHNRERSHARA